MPPLGMSSQPTHSPAFCDTPWPGVRGNSLHLDGLGSRSPLARPLLVGPGPRFPSEVWRERSGRCLDVPVLSGCPSPGPVPRPQASLGAFPARACLHSWVAGICSSGAGK